MFFDNGVQNEEVDPLKSRGTRTKNPFTSYLNQTKDLQIMPKKDTRICKSRFTKWIELLVFLDHSQGVIFTYKQ